MSSLFKQFKTNEGLEKKGILLEYGKTTEGKDICIRIARAGGANKQFDRRMEILTKPIRRQLQNETHDPATLDAIIRRVYAETVVLGWENVCEDDVEIDGVMVSGPAIPFTVDNCIALFERLPDLFADIRESAMKAALFRQANLEADGKN